MAATLLRHDLLQSEVEALEGRLRAAKDFVGVANANARGYTTMMSSEQVPNSEVGSLRPQGRRFLDELRLDQHLLTQRLVDEENERLVAALSKDIIIAFGDFSEQSSWKGRAPRKGKGNRLQKAKRFLVRLTKEWMTSKMCSCCMREEMERWRRVWGLVHCSQVSIIRACVLRERPGSLRCYHSFLSSFLTLPEALDCSTEVMKVSSLDWRKTMLTHDTFAAAASLCVCILTGYSSRAGTPPLVLATGRSVTQAALGCPPVLAAHSTPDAIPRLRSRC